MNLSNFSAKVSMQNIQREFSYDNVVMLTFTMNYPKVVLSNNKKAQRKMNSHIYTQNNDFYRYIINTLYPQAVMEYKYDLENDFPFRMYDAVMQYEVTYNADCYLSTYYDRYEFTGGAHGNTIRSSDTWSLKTGNERLLWNMFQPNVNYRYLLIEEILKQTDQQMKENPGIYFDNYQTLIVQYFNPKSFYLTEGGLAIYYQQYEIAPYATGIVSFTIPYATLGWMPTCSK